LMIAVNLHEVNQSAIESFERFGKRRALSLQQTFDIELLLNDSSPSSMSK
jgi:hypothetical protein